MDQAINIIYNALNALGTQSPILQPITSQPSGPLTYFMPSLNGNFLPGSYLMYIPSKYLVASSGGPYNLTILSQKKNTSTVLVPIIENGDTILSGNLFFWVYVDSSGNVTSAQWQVDASNSSTGNYIQKSDGSATADFTDGTARTTTTQNGVVFYYGGNYSLPITFYSIQKAIATANYQINMTWGGDISIISMSLIALYMTGSASIAIGYPGFHIEGRWHA
jgi:hypothetical protein